MNPLVSVVVTTYNQAAFIGETIRSALGQTYHPYEVIVVDDGSTDGTPACIAAFGAQVTCIRQSNRGVAGSRNTGIRLARGELIAFLDGDDLWEPEKLSVQVAAAARYPDSGLIVVDGSEFDAGGTISESLFFEPWCREIPDDSVISGRCHHQLLQCNFISTTSQVMVPAKVFEVVGLSDQSFARASDYDLYIRIAAVYDVTIVKKQLTHWRCLPTSVSGPRNLRGFRYLPEEIAVTKKHLQLCSRKERTLMRRIVKNKLAAGAEKLYHFGFHTDRRFATRALLKLLADNWFSPLVAAFIVGLWCPLAVTNAFGKMVRRILKRKCTDTQNTVQISVNPA